MYKHCIANNPACSGCVLKLIDNHVENAGIPNLYNATINSLDLTRPRWLIFCHEDFRPLERLDVLLEGADPAKIYGPIGPRLVQRHKWLLGGIWYSECMGLIEQSNKDGSRPIPFGHPVERDAEVDSVDCQCLIVHSSLVKNYSLRFDEQLTFDLYTDDFCFSAKVKHGIVTAILPFKCQHYSYGNVLPRFFEQKSYLDKKYNGYEFAGSVGYTIGNGRTWTRRAQKQIRLVLDNYAPWVVKLIFYLMPE